MKSNLLFDFIVDKTNNTLTIKREFNGAQQLIWDCYTKRELLEQWFAPAPLTAKTKSIDFREGGHWHYAMIDPSGKEYWGYTEYITIKPIAYYTSLDAFSNEAGEIDKELPRAKWHVTFSAKEEITLVETIVYYNSPSDLEAIITMGMQAGMEATLKRLEDLLTKI